MDASQDDMYLFNSSAAAFPGSAFDEFLPDTPAKGEDSSAFLNPDELNVKQEPGTPSAASKSTARKAKAQEASASASSSQTMTTPQLQNRNFSLASTTSPSTTAGWSTGINGFSMPAGSADEMFADTDMTGVSGLDADFEASNTQMASDFDFDTAASTPSAFANATLAPPVGPIMTTTSGMRNFRGSVNFTGLPNLKGTSPLLPTTSTNPFYFGASREGSPLNAMLPASSSVSPWNKHSPASGLEDNFNGMAMNGDSPGNQTFPNTMHFGSNNEFSFEPESSATPSTFAKEISSPPSTINSADGPPQLFVFPTSLKSRVETQIPIKMTLSPLPAPATKLRLPSHTVSKPKFLAKPEADRSPEILELFTSLVCTSALQDPVKYERAFARARGEDPGSMTRPSPASASSSSTHTSREDEERPLNGGEVRICSGCIQRERKRASRKKQKKPDEEEMFQKDEEKRVIVFNTNEIKEWQEPAKDPSGKIAGAAGHPIGNSAMQVELPMRIACYCRHQNEKLGFQVIFTIKDWQDKVVAQAITNSIMITDDHKTHNAPPPVPTQPATNMPAPTPVPGAGVFQSGMEGLTTRPGALFKSSYSTTDLHNLQQSFNPQYNMGGPNPFAMPGTISAATSTTMTPRNLSRPASPNLVGGGPIIKRRKQSGSGKLPTGLTMTRLDTIPGPSGAQTMPNSAVTSPYAQHAFMTPQAQNFPQQQLRHPPPPPPNYGTSPPTPNSNDHGFITAANRSYSMENLPRQTMISAPNSRPPTRPSSPHSNRNSFGTTDPSFTQAVSSQLYNSQQQRRSPPSIIRLTPNRGSMSGGYEVTLLGSGFYHGLDVMFGDIEATTTTFWHEKTLTCLVPPSASPGRVPIMFKHEHMTYSQMPPQAQKAPHYFTYEDDRMPEMYKLAIQVVGRQLNHPSDDPASIAERLLGQNMGQKQQNPYYDGGYGGPPDGQMRGYANKVLYDTAEQDLINLLDWLDLRFVGSSSLLNLQTGSGFTLLHFAASLGLTRAVAGLLARSGVTPDVRDKSGWTPMHHAAQLSHTHIIHRLRLAGANHEVRSFKNYLPADVASSLQAHQAALIQDGHYRSRSLGGTPMRLHSREPSSLSLSSRLAADPINRPYAQDFEDLEYYDDDSSDDDSPDDGIMTPTQSSVSLAATPLTASRRSSGQALSQAVSNTAEIQPQAFANMMAWRDNLAAQIQQFQESAGWTLSQLPALPQLPSLADYQPNNMMRRASQLFEQRPFSPTKTQRAIVEESEPLRSDSVAPPAYEEIFPKSQIEDIHTSTKKQGALQAAAEAALDQHYEQQKSEATTTMATYGSKRINMLAFILVSLITNRFPKYTDIAPAASTHPRHGILPAELYS